MRLAERVSAENEFSTYVPLLPITSKNHYFPKVLRFLPWPLACPTRSICFRLLSMLWVTFVG